MHAMSAFDIPIHTKNISTRDFALRHDADEPVSKKERAPGAHRHAHRRLLYVVAVAASVNSGVSLCLHALHASGTSLYYHASFVALFGSMLWMLYTF
jgi:hypothetical protein